MSGGEFKYLQFKLNDPIDNLKGRLILNHMSHAEAKIPLEGVEYYNPEIYNAIYSLAIASLEKSQAYLDAISGDIDESRL